jgi:hypothetical protein
MTLFGSRRACGSAVGAEAEHSVVYQWNKKLGKTKR